MSATDELRAELTKRGVEWRYKDERTTYWYGTFSGMEWCEWTAIDYNGYLRITCADCGELLTPAQVIAATLGDVPHLPYFWTHDDALHIELPRLPESISVRLPDQRDREVGSARTWQYTQDSGTCKDVCNSVSEFTCSVCGFNCDLTSWISLFDGDDGRHRHHHHGTPNYCPNCGRRVVEVDE